MISNMEIVTKFIKETDAFNMLPKAFLNLTKEKLAYGEWKVYRFKARVINDTGWEIDKNIGENEPIYATYCWTGNDEYCITTPRYLEYVKTTYSSDCICVFSI